MMKIKSFLTVTLLCLGALATVSCSFTGNHQGENAAEPQPAEEISQPAAPSAGADRSDVDLQEAKELLKELFGSIAKSLQKTDSVSVSEEVVEEKIPEEEEPARELKWYEKDYSITVVDLDENVTYTYTRKGKKMTIQGKGGGRTQKEDMDILDNGTIQSKVYHNGQYVRTYTLEKTPEDVIKLYLNSSKTNLRVIGNYPKPVATSKSDTRCGRPCWVVSKVTEEGLLGYSTRKEDVYYVDKEYGFIYEKKSSASGNVGVSYKDKSHFRVTAFTDKP